MGGICGKNYHQKKPVEQAAISVPAPQNQPKPQVYNPYLDKSQGSPQKNEKEVPKQNSNILKNSNPNPPQSNRKDNPPNKQEFELNMSPDKNSPQKTEKSKGNIIKESEYVTPRVIENPKSNSNPQNDILIQQNIENVPVEAEKNVILEAGEFLNEEIFGEDDFALLDEKNLNEFNNNINNEPQNSKDLPVMIFAKAILDAPEIIENGFDIDLFEEIPTFDNELDEEEESLKKSDIQELNSSGIQYKENQYGVSIENRVNRKHIKAENFNEEKNSQEKSINIEMKLDFNQAIIEEKYEDSPDLKASSLNEKPFDLPLENNMEPHFIDNSNFHEGRMDESPQLENGEKVNPFLNNEEEKHEKQFEMEGNSKEQEFIEDNYDDRNNNNKSDEDYMHSNEYGEESENSDDKKAPIIKEAKIDLNKVDDDFFLHKVDMDFLQKEEGEEDFQVHDENDKSLQDLEDGSQSNAYLKNDYSFEEITPAKFKERISVNPNSASLKKKLIWWSSKK